MSKKIINIILVVVLALLVIGFIYYNKFFLLNDRQINNKNLGNAVNQKEKVTQTQDENYQIEQNDKIEEPATNTPEFTENEDTKNGKELTPEEKSKQQALMNMTDDELINLLGNIFQMPPQESINKYGAEYISSMLKELGNRMNDMNEEQKQKVINLLKTFKPPQLKENQ